MRSAFNVFISSTAADLNECRSAVKQVIDRLCADLPSFELFGRASQPVEVAEFLQASALQQHFAILGAPGSGKTAFLQTVARQALEAATVIEAAVPQHYPLWQLRPNDDLICQRHRPQINDSLAGSRTRKFDHLAHWDALGYRIESQREITVVVPNLNRASDLIRYVRINLEQFKNALISLLRRHLRRLNELAAVFLRVCELWPPQDDVAIVERKWFLYHGVGRPPRALSRALATGSSLFTGRMLSGPALAF
jgi:hypothetical protein